ncbi:MAG: DUF166 domain-containing protein [Candidatus Bathyarchaeia archaeon]
MAGNLKISICALIQGWYGHRIVSNIERRIPEGWRLEACEFPRGLPDPVEDPSSILPKLPRCDLILSLGEHPSVAAMLPEIVQATTARSVICPVDSYEWVPSGLSRQVSERLFELGVAYTFPKPLCSLQENIEDEYIRTFAERFGRPKLRITLNGKVIGRVDVLRGSPCGSTYFVSEKLTGLSVDEAASRAGLLMQIYPCLASRVEGPKYREALIHVASNIMMGAVQESLLKATIV